MNPDDKELLEKTFELAQENNQMLHSMRRSMRFGTFLRAIYWILILAGVVGSYIYVQPLIGSLLQSYQQAMGGFEDVKKSVNGFNAQVQSSQSIIDQLKGLVDQARTP